MTCGIQPSGPPSVRWHQDQSQPTRNRNQETNMATTTPTTSGPSTSDAIQQMEAFSREQLAIQMEVNKVNQKLETEKKISNIGPGH